MNGEKPMRQKCSFVGCRKKPVFVSEEELSPQCCISHISQAMRKWKVTALIPIEIWNTKTCPQGSHSYHVGCRKGRRPAPSSTYSRNPYYTDMQDIQAHMLWIEEQRRAKQQMYELGLRDSYQSLPYYEPLRVSGVTMAQPISLTEKEMNKPTYTVPEPMSEKNVNDMVAALGGSVRDIPPQDIGALRSNKPFENALVDKMFGF